MRVGIARPSILDESVHQQHEDLVEAGCVEVHHEVPAVQPGDVVVMTGLERAGANIPDQLALLQMLHAARADIRILTIPHLLTGPDSLAALAVLEAVALSEHHLYRERTKRGLDGRVARGLTCGRPVLVDAKKAAWARKYKSDHPEVSWAKIANTPEVGFVNVKTLRRALCRYPEENSTP